MTEEQGTPPEAEPIEDARPEQPQPEPQPLPVPVQEQPQQPPPEPQPEQPPAQQQAEDDGTRPPNEWREALFPTSARGTPHPDGWKHGAAAALHGWLLHEHHAGEPMRLSEADYRAALDAASNLSAEGGYTPHDAALSPHFRALQERT